MKFLILVIFFASQSYGTDLKPIKEVFCGDHDSYAVQIISHGIGNSGTLGIYTKGRFQSPSQRALYLSYNGVESQFVSSKFRYQIFETYENDGLFGVMKIYHASSGENVPPLAELKCKIRK